MASASRGFRSHATTGGAAQLRGAPLDRGRTAGRRMPGGRPRASLGRDLCPGSPKGSARSRPGRARGGPQRATLGWPHRRGRERASDGTSPPSSWRRRGACFPPGVRPGSSPSARAPPVKSGGSLRARTEARRARRRPLSGAAAALASVRGLGAHPVSWTTATTWRRRHCRVGARSVVKDSRVEPRWSVKLTSLDAFTSSWDGKVSRPIASRSGFRSARRPRGGDGVLLNLELLPILPKERMGRSSKRAHASRLRAEGRRPPSRRRRTASSWSIRTATVSVRPGQRHRHQPRPPSSWRRALQRGHGGGAEAHRTSRGGVMRAAEEARADVTEKLEASRRSASRARPGHHEGHGGGAGRPNGSADRGDARDAEVRRAHDQGEAVSRARAASEERAPARDLNPGAAVEQPYAAELTRAEEALPRAPAVLIECDKELVAIFYAAIRNRLKKHDLAAPTSTAAPPDAPGVPTGVIGTMISQLLTRCAVRGRARRHCCPSLDLLPRRPRAGSRRRPAGSFRSSTRIHRCSGSGSGIRRFRSRRSSTTSSAPRASSASIASASVTS